MHNTSLPAIRAAQQAAQSALQLNRIGFHQEAVILWRAAISVIAKRKH
ncbi:hypothetical protein [Aeromonas caviae]|nr:hypothetical protein [Aeromonas caviae]